MLTALYPSEDTGCLPSFYYITSLLSIITISPLLQWILSRPYSSRSRMRLFARLTLLRSKREPRPASTRTLQTNIIQTCVLSHSDKTTAARLALCTYFVPFWFSLVRLLLSPSESLIEGFQALATHILQRRAARPPHTHAPLPSAFLLRASLTPPFIIPLPFRLLRPCTINVRYLFLLLFILLPFSASLVMKGTPSSLSFTSTHMKTLRQMFGDIHIHLITNVFELRLPGLYLFTGGQHSLYVDMRTMSKSNVDSISFVSAISGQTSVAADRQSTTRQRACFKATRLV
ncbi:hypothetical protein CPB85DRAFT_88921 [Mucidula mucida]|nr:hypothetical protein CPB85DRAFT_88921 [Mucidula mucida]